MAQTTAMTTEPALLGQFLELGVCCDDILASLEFYRRVGFTVLPVGDIVPTPYAVVALPEAPIGLHVRDFPEPTLTFVRPEVAGIASRLEARGIEIEFAQLSADTFHCMALRDPDEMRVLLLEARTYSAAPPSDASVPVCGRFVEWALPTHALERTLAFWKALGFAVVTSESPDYVRLEGGGTRIGLYAQRGFAPGPRFACTDLDARLEFLRAQGVEARGRSPLPGAGSGTRLEAPEGTALYLHEG